MFTTIKSKQTTSQIANSDWDFLPNMFSATLGIMIGWTIALMLGWV